MKKWLVALFSVFALMGSALAAVDINTANQQQLEAIKGIGPAKAKAIIDYRTAHGAFKTAEDIQQVPGIKGGTFKKIAPEITVGGKGAAPAPAGKASAPAKAAPTAAPKASAPAAKPAKK
ncbi:competence protein ComEA [Andreprevotia lacus DSM 23236]|jgi:competence protein ComEA|uniref:Competence protein ComEA n=1 Tax=Andreprevotia lacus DSM 23236 TaxID=1121001 RepID=A0A1W1WZX6_9NEIS|nr:helix-hairpin-helix domain-containing protein [Andreprevotia lacus]SMC16998.1 competence protein ComEA [Andreprevotia lacus DSM 23236]